MFFRSGTLCLTAFLVLTPAILAADPEWAIDWYFNEISDCTNKPDISDLGSTSTPNSNTGTTECFH